MRLKKSLSSKYNYSEFEFKNLTDEIQKKIDHAWDNALKEPSQEWNEVTNYVYKNN